MPRAREAERASQKAASLPRLDTEGSGCRPCVEAPRTGAEAKANEVFLQLDTKIFEEVYQWQSHRPSDPYDEELELFESYEK